MPFCSGNCGSNNVSEPGPSFVKNPSPDCTKCKGKGNVGRFCGFGQRCSCTDMDIMERQEAIWSFKVDSVTKSLLGMMGETAVTEGLVSLVCDHIYNTFAKNESEDVGERSFGVLTKLRFAEQFTATQKTKVPLSKPLEAAKIRQMKAAFELCTVYHTVLQSEMAKVKVTDHPLLLTVDTAFHAVATAMEGQGGDDEACIARIRASEQLALIHKLLKSFDAEREAVKDELGQQKQNRASGELDPYETHKAPLPTELGGCEPDLYHKISNAWMALNTSLDSQDDPSDSQDVPSMKVAFIGVESVGKSTLVNFIVDTDGGGDDFLPVGDGMVTQTLTMVRNETFPSLTTSNEPFRKPMGVAEMADKIKKGSEQIKETRERGSKDLSNLMFFHAQRPWSGEAKDEKHLELIDVPGYKASTKEELYLALGISDKLVLCAADAELLEMQLRDGALCQIPIILREVRKDWNVEIPVILVVTRSTNEDYTRDLASYQQVMETYFGYMHFNDIVWANCHDLYKQHNVPGIRSCIRNLINMIKEKPKFFSGGRNRTKAVVVFRRLQKRIVNAVDRVETSFAKEMENLPAQTAYTEKKALFLVELAKTIGNIKKRREEGKLADTKRQEELESAMSQIKPAKADIPIFTTMLAGEVQTNAANSVLIAEAMVLESRVAFLDVVVRLTDKVFKEMWAGFVSFDNVDKAGIDKAVKDKQCAANVFCDVLESLSAVRPWDRMEGKQEWNTACGHFLSQCRPGDFGCFVGGYYLSCIDGELKKAVVSGLVADTGRAEQEFTASDVTQQQAHLLTSAIEFFHKSLLPKQIKAVNCFRGKPIDFPRKQMELVHEAALYCCKEVKACTVFGPESPFVKKLVEFAIGMAQHIFMSFKIHGAEYSWDFSDFKKHFDEVAIEEPLKHVEEALRHMNDPDLGDKRVLELICTACSVVESDSKEMELTDDINDELRGISMDLAPVFERVKKSAAKDASHECDLLLMSMTRDKCMNLEDPLKTALVTWPEIRIQTFETEEVEGFAAKCLDQAACERPAVIAIVRRPDVLSTDLHDTELNVVDQLRTIRPVPSIVWISSTENKVKEGDHWYRFSAEVGGRRTYTPSDVLSPGNEGLLDILRRAKAEATMKCTMEASRRDHEFREAKEAICALLRRYSRLKREGINAQELLSLIRELHPEAKKQLALLKEEECTSEFTIRLPDTNFLCDNFVDETAALEWKGQRVYQAQELQARTFINKIIVGQIVDKAMQVGEKIFTTVIERIVARIAQKFNLRSRVALDAIETYYTKRRLDSPDDKQLHVVGFLRRKSFISMYVGGTVMSVMPLLSALVVPELCEVGKTVASTDKYKKRRTQAESAMAAMRLD